MTEAPAFSQTGNGHLAALPAERLHSLLRRMSDQDWSNLKSLLTQSLDSSAQGEIAILERMFRKGEALAGQAGGTIFRLIQLILTRVPLLEEVRKANEHLRARVRFVLREMSEADWQAFKLRLSQTWEDPGKADEIRVLELVCRFGESVSNVEVAALALAEQHTPHRWLTPEVVRRNALLKAKDRRSAEVEAQAAYVAAKHACETREGIARRAESTLAYEYAEPTQPFKHARNTVFKFVDAIAEAPHLMEELGRIEQTLLRVPPLSREQMRWALHRMPKPDRLAVIRCIPLNTILMFQQWDPGNQKDAGSFRATRDRRLAYELFLKGQSDEELARAFGLSVNAVKNTVGMILQHLIERPLARKLVHEYLERVEAIPPMTVEIRRAVKRLSSNQRAELLEKVPHSAWKAREVIPLHKHLFLDYLSGEWVLSALVAYYNLQKDKRLTGLFQSNGSITVRGANSAIEGILHKIAEEPELREQLRNWSTPNRLLGPAAAEPVIPWNEPTLEQFLPLPPRPRPECLPQTCPAPEPERGLVEVAA